MQERHAYAIFEPRRDRNNHWSSRGLSRFPQSLRIYVLWYFGKGSRKGRIGAFRQQSRTSRNSSLLIHRSDSIFSQTISQWLSVQSMDECITLLTQVLLHGRRLQCLTLSPACWIIWRYPQLQNAFKGYNNLVDLTLWEVDRKVMQVVQDLYPSPLRKLRLWAREPWTTIHCFTRNRKILILIGRSEFFDTPPSCILVLVESRSQNYLGVYIFVLPVINYHIYVE